jgi:hypothetical protein
VELTSGCILGPLWMNISPSERPGKKHFFSFQRKLQDATAAPRRLVPAISARWRFFKKNQKKQQG